MVTVTKIGATTLPVVTEHIGRLADVDRMIFSYYYQKKKSILQVVMDDPRIRNANIQRQGFIMRVRRHVSRRREKMLTMRAVMLALVFIYVIMMVSLVSLSPSPSSSQECNLLLLACSNDENDTNCFFGNNYDYNDTAIHSRIGNWFSHSLYMDNDNVDESSFGMTGTTTSSVETILRVILTTVTLMYLYLACKLQHSLMLFCLTRCQEKIRRFQQFCRQYQHHLQL